MKKIIKFGIFLYNYIDKKLVKNNSGIKYIQVSLSVREEKTLVHELKPLKAIRDNYPKYIITLDYENVDHEGIKQINAIDFLLGRVDL